MAGERQYGRKDLYAMQQRSLQLGKELERELSALRAAYQTLDYRAGTPLGARDAQRVKLAQAEKDGESAHAEVNVSSRKRVRIAGGLRARPKAKEPAGNGTPGDGKHQITSRVETQKSPGPGRVTTQHSLRHRSTTVVAGMLLGILSSVTALLWVVPKEAQTLAETGNDLMQPVGHSLCTADAEKAGTAEADGNLPTKFLPRPRDHLTHTDAGNTVNRRARSGPNAYLTHPTAKPGHDALVYEQQSNLITLGFDLGTARADGVKGRRTKQALAEFKLFYLPILGLQAVEDDEHLASIIRRFADMVREDAKRYNVSREVLAAIRLAHMRTGVNFRYLMELAETESSFDPMERAFTSSATGLYQFTDSTWIKSVKTYGQKYGLGMYASEIEHSVNNADETQFSIRNPIIYQHVLNLRFNPRFSALLAAEFSKNNEQRLSRLLGREFGRTELYLAHFLGMKGALNFLEALANTPDQIASDIFPHAAKTNQSIFQPGQNKGRTISEVYKYFDEKFRTSRYETPSADIT